MNEETERLEEFIQFLETRVGYINRKDPETISCLKDIMKNKISVFGDLFIE